MFTPELNQANAGLFFPLFLAEAMHGINTLAKWTFECYMRTRVPQSEYFLKKKGSNDASPRR
jgi:hypothetical protein